MTLTPARVIYYGTLNCQRR